MQGATGVLLTMTKNCPIDGLAMQHAFDHAVLNRHMAAYYQCGTCGLLQVGDPHWLEDLYKQEITDLDPWVGIRNVINARRLEPILWMLFPQRSIFVEDACGYGLLTRLMRDAGFEFYGEDPYCKPIFCERFPPPRDVRATAVLAIEVLEHVMDPVAFVRSRLAHYRTDVMIASTSVFSGAPPDPSWPYYAFQTGQHVTLYQTRSLAALAGVLNLHYHRLGSDLHLFSRVAIPAWKILALRSRHLSPLCGMWTRIRRRGMSLTQADYEARLKELGSAKAPELRT